MKIPVFTLFILIIVVLINSMGVVNAREVNTSYNDLTLNANLELAEGKSLQDGVILMTHGTLAHNNMEIMATLQEVFKEQGQNTLAINLSLSLNDRHGFYDCATPHKHKHTDALDEIGVWLNWLKQQGAKNIVLLGHSRGGNQTAWFASERDDPEIKAVVLIAPALWDAESAAKDYKKRYDKNLQPVLDKAKALSKAGNNAWMEHTDFIYCKDTKVEAATFVSYYDPDPRRDTVYLLPKIAKPVLVFAGSEDTTVKDVDKKVAPLADDKKIKLVVLDGADHFFRDLYVYDIVENSNEYISGK
jgi:pimeloyl-ACP methyl ester carboxylesterase